MATKVAKAVFEVGKKYFIRCLTYHYTGELVQVTPTELVLEKAAWVADSGRFTEAMAKGTLSEVEPYPDNCKVIINRQNIVDASEWNHPLPRTQK